MSSVVIAGDTSGSITLQAPAVSGSTVLTLPASTGTVLTQNSSAPANSLVVDASGNVGIGTSLPSTYGKLAAFSTNAAQTAYNGQTLALYSTDSMAIDLGGSIGFGGSYTGTSATLWAAISGRKENAIDTNTSGYLSFATRAQGFAPAECMRIDSSGNVGIGTSSVTQAYSAITASIAGNLRLGSGSATGFICFGDQTSSTANVGIWRAAGGNSITSGNYLQMGGYAGITFTTGNASLISQTERMRIDSSGNLLVGTTAFPSSASKMLVSGDLNATYTNGVIQGQSKTAGDVSYPALYLSKFDNNSTTSQVLVRFAIGNYVAGQGQINANGANAAAFGSFSDRRLKENIEDLPSQLSNITSLRPVEFDYIAGGHQIGFIAQEMQEVYPDVVGEGDDGMLTITGWSKTEAKLVKAIQELKAIIDTQQIQINSLLGK